MRTLSCTSSAGRRERVRAMRVRPDELRMREAFVHAVHAMSTPRQIWRYIAWTRALARGDRCRALALNLARQLDDGRGPYPSLACRLLDRIGGFP